MDEYGNWWAGCGFTQALSGDGFGDSWGYADGDGYSCYVQYMFDRSGSLMRPRGDGGSLTYVGGYRNG